MEKKYSDLLCEWLSELGYTKCFYVAGGNIMHILESASRVFDCIPFVHEVAAGIAAEYYNEGSIDENQKAFVLVTAGPGLTNLTTAISGSFLESRDLLIVGGQVKSVDLKRPGMRQRGIQEIDGVSLVQSITKIALRIDTPLPRALIVEIVMQGRQPRKGPIFLEICLDVQAANLEDEFQHIVNYNNESSYKIPDAKKSNTEEILSLLVESERPVLLLGGEISRLTSSKLMGLMADSKIPLMTTWNAADRIPYNQENFFGRPDTWGMRYANILIQQADLVVAIGARLSLQQTGFNYSQFVPHGKIVHIFSDSSEFDKGLSNVVLQIAGNADFYLEKIIKGSNEHILSWTNWSDFCRQVKNKLPLSEECNEAVEGYWNPYEFYSELSGLLESGETLVPSSSGGAETVAMQSFKQNEGVRIITSSTLASMGYGLAGAIGASLLTKKRVCLVEGDGGFAQNLQELGTAERQKLNLKIFVFCNEGYASIRMTQRNYFRENYIGCDRNTGLGLPDWGRLFDAYGINWMTLDANKKIDQQAGDLWRTDGLAAFLVPIHPEQSYFPKISSRVLDNGAMESNPLHQMTPSLNPDLETQVFKYF